ncbi:hypothetical protein [Engelhardtia mirabilis]|uniref:Uncharacterized protein n=1 Tax=Engelhardtia mirabilis TaxID=2528011 RepID=A0A518BMT5_9BACT|nr:hypothetical protein Pla133_33870 [Planctomycetes bacterium Pla133]QDV02617.1 hypothetical protein Pla86_33860 [Planctomycetes bacterium Pla86]
MESKLASIVLGALLLSISGAEFSAGQEAGFESCPGCLGTSDSGAASYIWSFGPLIGAGVMSIDVEVTSGQCLLGVSGDPEFGAGEAYCVPFLYCGALVTREWDGFPLIDTGTFEACVQIGARTLCLPEYAPEFPQGSSGVSTVSIPPGSFVCGVGPYVWSFTYVTSQGSSTSAWASGSCGSCDDV